MIITIQGIRNVRFTDKNSGQVISGQTVFYTFSDDHIDGLGTDKFFLPESRAINVPVMFPVNAEIYYNKYGKVDTVLF